MVEETPQQRYTQMVLPGQEVTAQYEDRPSRQQRPLRNQQPREPRPSREPREQRSSRDDDGLTYNPFAELFKKK